MDSVNTCIYMGKRYTVGQRIQRTLGAAYVERGTISRIDMRGEIPHFSLSLDSSTRPVRYFMHWEFSDEARPATPEESAYVLKIATFSIPESIKAEGYALTWQEPSITARWSTQNPFLRYGDLGEVEA